jgi:hypothetical protein
MKTYKAILLTVLGLVVVVGGSYFYMRNHKAPVKETVSKNNMVTLEGQVTRMYEGENKLVYSFDVPASATSTMSMDNALVKVTNDGALYMAVYMSYEGGRGYSVMDYVNANIGKRVKGLVVTGTTTINGIMWTVAQTPQTEWHVAQVGDGQWLMIVENNRSLHDKIVSHLETLKTK